MKTSLKQKWWDLNFGASFVFKIFRVLFENFEEDSNLNSIKFFFLSSLYPLCSLSPLPCLAPGRPEAAGLTPRAAHPARSPPTWFAQTGHPNPLDLATRRHPVRARRGPPTKRHGDAVRCRPTASALSLAQARLESSREHHNALTPLSFLPERESQLRAPPFA